MNLMDTKLAEVFEDKAFYIKGLAGAVTFTVAWYFSFFMMPRVMELTPVIPIAAAILQIQFLKSHEIKKTILAGVTSITGSKVIWAVIAFIGKGMFLPQESDPKGMAYIMMMTMAMMMISEFIGVAVAIFMTLKNES